MNAARCLACPGSAPDRPGTHLVFADRKERYEVQEAVRRSDEARQRRLTHSQIFQERGLILWLESRDLRLDTGRQHHTGRIQFLEPGGEPFGQGLAGLGLPTIQGHEQWSVGEQPITP